MAHLVEARWLGIAVAVASALGASPQQAHAKSDQSFGTACPTCHVSPSAPGALCPLELSSNGQVCFASAFYDADKDGDGFTNGEEVRLRTNHQLAGDVDECTKKLDGAPLADCAQLCVDGVLANRGLKGDFACDCRSGYQKQQHACREINECSEHTATCAPHSTCQNLPGSYECPCNADYFGDGAIPNGCSQDDHCALATPPCSPLSKCITTAAAFECRSCLSCDTPCPPGFQGNGKGPGGCVDIKECEQQPSVCDPLANCTELVGGYACGDCPEGYSGDGSTGCVPLDLCAISDCSPHATCVPGSPEGCECIAGYTGDGSTCDDIDECDSDPCPTGTECSNLPGSYVCSCPAGTRWVEGDCEQPAPAKPTPSPPTPSGAGGEGGAVSEPSAAAGGGGGEPGDDSAGAASAGGAPGPDRNPPPGSGGDGGDPAEPAPPQAEISGRSDDGGCRVGRRGQASVGWAALLALLALASRRQRR